MQATEIKIQAPSVMTLYEKKIVLDLAKRIKQKLQAYENVDIKLSRNKDEYLLLFQRTDMANYGAQIAYLSLHLNSATVKALEDSSLLYILEQLINRQLLFKMCFTKKS